LGKIFAIKNGGWHEKAEGWVRRFDGR